VAARGIVVTRTGVCRIIAIDVWVPTTPPDRKCCERWDYQPNAMIHVALLHHKEKGVDPIESKGDRIERELNLSP
jgi:hypothetical protein